MITTQYIHFSCLCGLDMYFFANLPGGQAPVETMERFRESLNSFPYMIFSSQDGFNANCDSCDLEIDLPKNEIVHKILESIKSRTKLEAFSRMPI